MQLNPGTVFAGYHVLQLLGQGGMGQVYLVESAQLHRREAMKTISVVSEADSEYHQRFVREARIAAQLSHPGIVTIHDFGVEDGVPWYTMAYLQGRDLSTERLSEPEVAEVVRRVASALDYAHQNDVVHRDIKPANILLQRDHTGRLNEVTILDFGIAKLTTATGLTAASTFIGTLTYSAPEVIGGAAATASSDQYSLACTAYRLLTGRPPFEGNSPSAVMAGHLSQPAPPISSVRPELAALDPIFAAALAKDPAQRFPDCGAFAAALQHGLASPRLAHGHPSQPQVGPVPPSRRRWYIAGGAVAAVMLLVAAVVGVTTTRDGGPRGSVTAIVGFGSDVCAIAAGKLHCFGANSGGLVGDGSTSVRSAPAPISSLDGVTDVSMGSDVACAVATGQVYCWGTESGPLNGADSETLRGGTRPVRIAGLRDVTSVSVAYSFRLGGTACAITRTGPYCWGFGTTSSVPVPLSGVAATATSIEVNMVGYGVQACALVDGKVNCWGGGTGFDMTESAPEQVKNLPQLESLAIGGQCGSSGRRVYCWPDSTGANVASQWASNVPDVTKVATGYQQRCVISSGSAYCSSGQTVSDPPTRVEGLDRVSDITAEGPHCAVSDGYVYCWGDLPWNKGTSNPNRTLTPVKIEGLG